MEAINWVELIRKLNGKMVESKDNPIITEMDLMFVGETEGDDWVLLLGNNRLVYDLLRSEDIEFDILQRIRDEIVSHIEAMRSALWAVDQLIAEREKH